MTTAQNQQDLGNPLRTKKKRGAVFIVIVASIAVHVLGLGALGVIKIVETIAAPPEFEAPPVEAIKPPPPPPPPPPTTKRTQRSLPRPQPLAAQNPQNMSVPAINLQDSDLSLAGGRGFGGGLGELGGGALDRVDFSFFGIEGGNRVAVLFDRTGSGRHIFKRTRQELKKTIESMTSNPDARLAVIYFGGREGGHQGLSIKGRDPTKYDYWYPQGIRSNTWLLPERGETTSLISELDKVDINKRPSANPEDRKRGKADFIVGTNFYGALKNAYKLYPAPDTVYIMVEPDVAFSNEKLVKNAYATWEKYGIKKPDNTKLIFVVGKPAKSVRNKRALNLAVNLFSGGDLSPEQIQEAIVYD